MEYRRARVVAGLVNAIEHQGVQVGVQIRRRAKALDQGDGAAGGFIPFDPGLLDQVRVERAAAKIRARECRTRGTCRTRLGRTESTPRRSALAGNQSEHSYAADRW